MEAPRRRLERSGGRREEGSVGQVGIGDRPHVGVAGAGGRACQLSKNIKSL